MKIVFTGDIAFSGYFKDLWKKPDLLESDVQTFLKEADAVIANIESPLTKAKKKVSKSMNHASSPETGAFLRDINIRYWNLANNHIMDCGAEGLYDTLDNAQRYHCLTIGAGETIETATSPVVIGNTVKAAVFSIAYPWEYVIIGNNTPGVLTWQNKEMLEKQIKAIRESVDWIILVAHGGDEYSPLPFPYLREKYKAFLDMGVDIIIGHHPHVVENYEFFGDKAIFYSLGNFMFDTDNQRRFCHTDTGILLNISFDKHKWAFDCLAVKNDREENVLRKTGTPPVFCEIPAKDYQMLWPASAYEYRKVDKKRRTSFNQKLSNLPLFFYSIYELYCCRRQRDRELQSARLKYLFEKPNLSRYGALGEYLLHQYEQTNESRKGK